MSDRADPPPDNRADSRADPRGNDGSGAGGAESERRGRYVDPVADEHGKRQINDDRFTRGLIGFNELAERSIAVAVVVVLVGIAGLIIYEATLELIYGLGGEEFALTKALSEILLALMIAEIVGTVSSFLRRGVFNPIPFLVVAVIASVRRLLVISAESAEFVASGTEIPNSFLYELGILTVTIGVCAWSIGYLRRRDPGTR